MKRNDIRAGVVYAIKSSYGPPSPIVFLEDGAAGLYSRGNYGRGPYRKLEENSHTKARVGKGFSEASRGYAVMERSAVDDLSHADAAGQMRAANPESELARFLADENPTADGLRFTIVTSLNQISGLYDEELAAYEAQREAERAADRRKRNEATARSERITAAVEALSAHGIRAKGAWEGRQLELSVDEAEKLIALLRNREA